MDAATRRAMRPCSPAPPPAIARQQHRPQRGAVPAPPAPAAPSTALPLRCASRCSGSRLPGPLRDLHTSFGLTPTSRRAHPAPAASMASGGSPSSSNGNSSSSSGGSVPAPAAGPGSAGAPPSSAAPASAPASASASAASAASAAAAAPTPAASTMSSITASDSTFALKPIHIMLFTLIFIGGALFATCTLQFTTNMEFTVAVSTVLRRVTRSVAFRQLVVIALAILAVRFGLNSVLQALSKWSANPVQWDKTKLYYILREVYQPLELLLCIAALCTIADSFVPSLISVPKSTVTQLVRSVLSMSFIASAASVFHNLKSRFCKENAWQSEMKGDVTGQRRWEAYDKLATFSIYAVSFVLGIQAIGLEVTSVLAIGGVGGLAIGLAGREIAENLLNGFLIMSTVSERLGHGRDAGRQPGNGASRRGPAAPNGRDSRPDAMRGNTAREERRFLQHACLRSTQVLPQRCHIGRHRGLLSHLRGRQNPFEVGDEVNFFHQNKTVEGFVIDIGWYRTLIRSFEREVYVIPNAVFSKNILLNITRKNREFRFHELVSVRVKDTALVNNIIQDIRRIVRSDARILSKLHRRIFLDKITAEACVLYVSFYVEAQNRDQFMAMKQDMLLAIVDCVERNGAQLAVPRRMLDLDPELMERIANAIALMDRPVSFRPALLGAGTPGDDSASDGDGDGLAQPLSSTSPTVVTASQQHMMAAEAAFPAHSADFPSHAPVAGAASAGGARPVMMSPAVDTTASDVVTPTPVASTVPPAASERDARPDAAGPRDAGAASPSGSFPSALTSSRGVVAAVSNSSGSSSTTGSSSSSSSSGNDRPSGGSSGEVPTPAVAVFPSGSAMMFSVGNNVVDAPATLRSSGGAAAISVPRYSSGGGALVDAWLRRLAAMMFQ